MKKLGGIWLSRDLVVRYFVIAGILAAEVLLVELRWVRRADMHFFVMITLVVAFFYIPMYADKKEREQNLKLARELQDARDRKDALELPMAKKDPDSAPVAQSR